MEHRVVPTSDGYCLAGPGGDVELANQFLVHLASQAFSPATVRAYAYDLLNFLRCLAERRAQECRQPRSRHPTLDANWNAEPKPFVWTKSADEILESFSRYCSRISDAGH